MGKDTAEKKVAQAAPAAPAAGPAGPVKQKPQGGGKAVPDVIAGMCRAEACKSKSDRFDFCTEHYEQFKFGLINKVGRQVPDYEKKWDHYQNFKSKSVAARKVA